MPLSPTCRLLVFMRWGSVREGTGGSPRGRGSSGGMLLSCEKLPEGGSSAKLTDLGTSSGVAWNGDVTCKIDRSFISFLILYEV